MIDWIVDIFMWLVSWEPSFIVLLGLGGACFAINITVFEERFPLFDLLGTIFLSLGVIILVVLMLAGPAIYQ